MKHLHTIVFGRIGESPSTPLNYSGVRSSILSLTPVLIWFTRSRSMQVILAGSIFPFFNFDNHLLELSVRGR